MTTRTSEGYKAKLAKLNRVMAAAHRLAAMKNCREDILFLEEIKTCCNGYDLVNKFGEPKDEPIQSPIVTADWSDTPNSKLPSMLKERLEELQIDAEWEDMISSCSDCDRVFEVQPTHAFWQPTYSHLVRWSSVIAENGKVVKKSTMGEPICSHCAKEYADESNDDYLSSFSGEMVGLPSYPL